MVGRFGEANDGSRVFRIVRRQVATQTQVHVPRGDGTSPGLLRPLALLSESLLEGRKCPENQHGYRFHGGRAFGVAAEVAAGGFAGVALEPAREALPRLAAVPILLLAASEPYVERRERDLARFRELAPQAVARVCAGASHDVLNATPAAVDLVAEWLADHAR